MIENGVPVKGYPKYQVNKNGDIFGPRGNKLTPSKRSGGYLFVRIYIDNKSSIGLTVQTIVARTFIGDVKGKIVHHVDGDVSNNNVNNLRIMTQSDHIRLHHNKPVVEIRIGSGYMKEWSSITEACKTMGYGGSNISHALNGKTSFAYGAYWLRGAA